MKDCVSVWQAGLQYRHINTHRAEKPPWKGWSMQFCSVRRWSNNTLAFCNVVSLEKQSWKKAFSFQVAKNYLSHWLSSLALFFARLLNRARFEDMVKSKERTNNIVENHLILRCCEYRSNHKNFPLLSQLLPLFELPPIRKNRYVAGDKKGSLEFSFDSAVEIYWLLPKIPTPWGNLLQLKHGFQLFPHAAPHCRCFILCDCHWDDVIALQL